MLDCLKCKHLNAFDIGCKAFPDGIPYEITEGLKLHNKVRPDQKGTFVFEPEEENEDDETSG